MKKILIGTGLVLFLAGCQKQQTAPTALPVPSEQATMTTAPIPEVTVTPGKDPKNATYIIEGQAVTLVNGKAETPAAPGSATMITTTIFGEPTKGELTGDTLTDAAVMLVQDQGGSGTFYYEAAALNETGGYVGTNAIILGDRIAPQTTQISKETIIVNYAQNAPGESMTDTPSEMVSKYLQVKGSRLIEVDQPQM